MASKQDRQKHPLGGRPVHESARGRDEQWRAYCPVHGCSVATRTVNEAQHCRRIHNDACDARAGEVERINNGKTERVCVDCGHVSEQRFGFVDGRIWRCFICGESSGGDDDGE